ncbi:MAG: glycosyltransferase family 2 protein [Clostridia bacterium]|nr:glycosyltransferase family 2 protein [Clostridia bacterium]
MCKISVIVPVYNVEPYLRRCVDSILNQTFSDFECILVDDGSPDGCPAICDEYAEKDSRVKVIHKKNGGLSDARNVGLDKANGKYVSFIDSDDWIHPQMLEILYKGLMDNNVLISVCEYKEVEHQEPYTAITEPIFETRYGMDFFITNHITAVIACSKLYDKSLFDDIRYPYGKLHEDEFVTYKLLYKAETVAYTNKPLYFYFQNENGITKSAYTIKRLDALEAMEERDQFLKQHKLSECRKFAMYQHIDFLKRHFKMTASNPEFSREHKQLKRLLQRKLLSEGIRCRIRFRYCTDSYAIAFPKTTRLLLGLKKIKDSFKSYLK